MGIESKAGTRLFSVVCATEVIVVQGPGGPLDITIGGVAPVTADSEREQGAEIVDGHDGGSAMGKRYVDTAGTIELLCTKPGDGSIALDGETLEVKGAQALPASD